jgi:hypothetical protein
MWGTGDHGPFNRFGREHLLLLFTRYCYEHSVILGCCCSWDRQAYLTEIRDGTPSLVPAQNNITKNLLFNSYSSTWPLVSSSH